MCITRLLPALACASMSLLGCSSGETRTTQPSEQEDRRAIRAALDSVASDISNRDGNSIAARMPTDGSVVYISDGRAIRGSALRADLFGYYSTLRALTFQWDSVEMVPLGDHAWVATAWAQGSATDSSGRVSRRRSIFTWTFFRARDHWAFGSAHKTTFQ